MKTIGKKIKELRISKGLTQENLIPDNPSQVSQIESGKIKNPTEPTLEMIAKALGIDCKSLVVDTDWAPGNIKTINTQYAYSPTKAIIEVYKTGEINAKLKSYPKFNDLGEENKYCPSTGVEMLSCCHSCSRPIESHDISYCMGCGASLKKYEISGYEIIHKDFWYNEFGNSMERARLKKKISSLTAWIMGYYNWMDFDQITEGYYPGPEFSDSTDEEFLQNFMDSTDTWTDWMLNEFDSSDFNWTQFREKHKSSNKFIRDTWCEYYLQLSYYYGIMKELERYSWEINKYNQEKLSLNEQKEYVLNRKAVVLIEDIISGWSDMFDGNRFEHLSEVAQEIRSFISSITSFNADSYSAHQLNKSLDKLKDLSVEEFIDPVPSVVDDPDTIKDPIKQPDIVDNKVSKKENGDKKFIKELPEYLYSIGSGLLSGVRTHFKGELKYYPKSGKYVEKPDNFWTVKVQPRDKSLRVTVRGLPSNFAHAKHLDIKNDMGSYSAFKVNNKKQLKEAIDVIIKAK